MIFGPYGSAFLRLLTKRRNDQPSYSRLITLMEDLKQIFLLLFNDMQNIIKMKFDSANYLHMLI